MAASCWSPTPTCATWSRSEPLLLLLLLLALALLGCCWLRARHCLCCWRRFLRCLVRPCGGCAERASCALSRAVPPAPQVRRQV
jgi:hypothetical protein